tara:strand:+ start:40 stop:270 length:231 start_codon:yes stop_codon:yes gene_type:complete
MNDRAISESNGNDKDKNISNEIDYKNIGYLKKFISETGKINPRRNSVLSGKEQRKMNKAIKIARYLALLPYCDNHK